MVSADTTKRASIVALIAGGVIQCCDQQRKAGIACHAGGLGKIIAGEAGTTVSSSQSGIMFAAP